MTTQRVDGRSSAARRFRRLCKQFAADLGDDLSEADQALVQGAAFAAMRVEDLRASTLRGEPVDDAHVVRLLNALHRLVGAVASKSRQRGKPAQSLDEYLADEDAE